MYFGTEEEGGKAARGALSADETYPVRVRIYDNNVFIIFRIVYVYHRLEQCFK